MGSLRPSGGFLPIETDEERQIGAVSYSVWLLRRLLVDQFGSHAVAGFPNLVPSQAIVSRSKLTNRRSSSVCHELFHRELRPSRRLFVRVFLQSWITGRLLGHIVELPSWILERLSLNRQTWWKRESCGKTNGDNLNFHARGGPAPCLPSSSPVQTHRPNYLEKVECPGFVSTHCLRDFRSGGTEDGAARSESNGWA